MNLKPWEVKYKSRILSSDDFFDILQREYVVCELRMKIYPTYVSEQILAQNPSAISPSEYWKNTCEKKKSKILSIAKKRDILSIFDDETMRIRIVGEVIPELGFPNFIYRDELNRFKQEKWDKHNYYSKKSNVKVYLEGKILNGVILYVDFPTNTAAVIIDNVTKYVQLECLTRIL